MRENKKNKKTENKTKTTRKSTEKVNNKKKNNNADKEKRKAIMKKVLIVIVILVIIGAGVLAGVLFGLFGGKFALTKQDLIINYSNSIVLDTDGNVIATLSAQENRKILTKADMGDYLPKAFVSIEDERFYKHHGVDIKRTGAAVATFLFHRGE